MAKRAQDTGARKDVVAGLVAALRDALEKPHQLSQEQLAAKAYEKLGFDFPVVSSQELSALAVVYRDSLLNRKSSKHAAPAQQGMYPLTPKFLENVLQGTSSATQNLTRSQTAAAPSQGSAASQQQSDAATATTGGLQLNTTAVVSSSQSSSQTGLPGLSTGAAPLQGELLQPLAPSLAALHDAYIQLASATLVDLVNTLISLPEHDAWALVSALAAEQQQQHHHHHQEVPPVRDLGHAQAPAGSNGAALANGDDDTVRQMIAHITQPNGAPVIPGDDAQQVPEVQDLGIIDVEASEEDDDDCVYEPLEAPPATSTHSPPFLGCSPTTSGSAAGRVGVDTVGGVHLHPSAVAGLSNGGLQLGSQLWPQLCQVIKALADKDNLSVLATALAAASSSSSSSPAATQPPDSSTSGNTGLQQGSTGPNATTLGGAPDAAHSYGVLAKSGSKSSAMVLGSLKGSVRTSTTGRTSSSSGLHDIGDLSIRTSRDGREVAQSQQPTLTQQQQQQGLTTSSASSSILLTTLDSVLGLLRTLGVHAHAADLTPLLASYTWLLAACLSTPHLSLSRVEEALAEVWQALGVTRWVSMPRGAALARSNRGGNSKGGAAGQPLLHPEAAAALSFIAHLSVMSQSSTHSTSPSGIRGALWRSLHANMLPVLERCLSDLAAAAQQLQRQQGEPDEALQQELAESVGLVCTSVLVYVESRPGGANPCKILLSAGVVRGLSLLLAALPSMPYLASCTPLLAAGWVLASGSTEVSAWMSAVPGVPAALQWLGSTQAPSAARVYGVAWQLLPVASSAKTAVAAGTVAQAPKGIVVKSTSSTAGPTPLGLLTEALQSSSSLEQVSEAERLLQMLVRGRKGADISSTPWLTPLQPALQAVAVGLKQQLSSSSGGGAGRDGSKGDDAVVQVASHQPSSSGREDGQEGGTCKQQQQQDQHQQQQQQGPAQQQRADAHGLDQDDHDHHGQGSPADDQQARSARQMASLLKSCQALVKQLQVTCGKAD